MAERPVHNELAPDASFSEYLHALAGELIFMTAYGARRDVTSMKQTVYEMDLRHQGGFKGSELDLLRLSVSGSRSVGEIAAGLLLLDVPEEAGKAFIEAALRNCINLTQLTAAHFQKDFTAGRQWNWTNFGIPHVSGDQAKIGAVIQGWREKDEARLKDFLDRFGEQHLEQRGTFYYPPETSQKTLVIAV